MLQECTVTEDERDASPEAGRPQQRLQQWLGQGWGRGEGEWGMQESRVDLVRSPPCWGPEVVSCTLRLRAPAPFAGIWSPCWHGSLLASSCPLLSFYWISTLHAPVSFILLTYLQFYEEPYSFFSEPFCILFPLPKISLIPLAPLSSMFPFQCLWKEAFPPPPLPTCTSLLYALSTLFLFLLRYFIIQHLEQ